MRIYWMFLVLSLIVLVWSENSYCKVYAGTHWEMRGRWAQAIAMFGVLIFFCGLRSGIADTWTYIDGFEAYPSRLSEVALADIGKGPLFYLFGVFYKQFISTDYHGWLFVLALISGAAVCVGFKRYSSSFGMTCYLFIATTTFTWFVNGMRQFICIAFVLCFTNLIVERKFWKFLLLILILALVHSSVLIMIPIYFIVRAKPWSKTMLALMGVAVIVGVGFEQIWPRLSVLLEDTAYEGYIDLMSTSAAGVNIIRVVVAAVPCILAFWGRRTVEEDGYPLVRMMVNLSVINLCLYIVAIFSSGMVIGRALAYFEIYNLLLLPWLMKHIFTENSGRFVSLSCILVYVLYFYYQMTVAWGIGYESDILGLYL